MSVELQLVDILDELQDADFNAFIWHLKKETWNGIQPIKGSRLQRVERMDVVDLMVQTYQTTGAPQVMMNILKKINRNDLVKTLEGLFPGVQAGDPKASSGSQVDPVEVLTSLRAQLVAKMSLQILQQLLDKMLEKKIMTDSEIELGAGSLGDKVRTVVDTVRKKGNKASSVFIAALVDMDPYLAEDLKLK